MRGSSVFLRRRAGKAEDGSIREGSFLRVRSWTPEPYRGGAPLRFYATVLVREPPLREPPLRERSARVLHEVIVVHPLCDVGVGPGYVLLHLRVLPQVEEPGLRPVAGGEHGVVLVARPDVVVVTGREV